MEVQPFGSAWTKMKDDPQALERILLTEATIRCANGQCFSGVVQAVDPSSKSIMLAQMESNEVKHLVLCVGSTIQEVLSDEKPSKHARIVDKIFQQEQELTAAELAEKRDRLMSHLTSHHLPCILDGEIIKIASLATIEPPYSRSEIFCQNEIIMERITKLVETLTD